MILRRQRSINASFLWGYNKPHTSERRFYLAVKMPSL